MKKNILKLRDKTFVQRAIRFSCTGLFVTAVHIMIAIFLLLQLKFSSLWANGAAFIGATIISYLINTSWSFSANFNDKTLSKFITVSIANFFLVLSIAWLTEQLQFNHLMGIICIVIIIPPLNFLMHNFWTYKNEEVFH